MAGLAIPVIAAPTAQAAGTPDVALTKTVDVGTLYGDAVAITLKASNAGTTAGYNLTFTDIIPKNTTFGTSSFGAPTKSIVLADGSTELFWSNVADLQGGTDVSLSYTYTYTSAAYDVGATFTSTAGAYVNSDARMLPKVNATTGVMDSTSYTGSATASATTKLVPFEVSKSEPSPESELLRGVHDHKTVYTIDVTNNKLATTSNFSVVDYLPAGLEFLGCTNVDNSTAGTVEYTGSGRIDATPLPTMTNCVAPASVTTVTVDPDGTGPLPTAVYTKVTWTGLGSLAANGALKIQYAAAIPLRENVAYAGANSTANLDNNTGALTSDEQQLTNLATATGTYAGTAYDVSDTTTVSAEDVAIQKSVAEPSIAQGEVSHWTLNIESSEYATSTQPIVVKDTIPDGLDYTSASPAPDATPVAQSDGTLLATWTLPAFTAKNGTKTITYTTTTRATYRNGGGPVSAEDSWENDVALTTKSTVITSATAGTTLLETDDVSSASQAAGGVTLTKEVSTAAATSTGACPTDDASFVKAAAGYHPGDVVCFRLTATFPGDLNTLSTTLTDMLPDGYTYVSSTPTASSSVTATGPTTSGQNVVWSIPNAAQGTKFQTIVKTKVSGNPSTSVSDITSNLAKLTYKNTKGKVFQLRDEADATLTKPVLSLAKTVATPAGTTIQAGDLANYTLKITNSGAQAATGTALRDILPTTPVAVTCAAVTSISNSGACASGVIDWSNLSVPANGSLSVTYTVTVPDGVAPGDSLVNTAGVRSYQGAANDGSTFTYYPASNVDTSITTAQQNAPAAGSTATVKITSPTVAKTVTATSVTETGNSALTQATIGETITYKIDTTIPEGVSLYGSPAITDTVPSTLAIVGIPSFTVGSGAAQDATVSGQKITAPLGTTYTTGDTAGDTHVVITVTAKVVDTATTVSGTSISNTATLTWKNAANTTATAKAPAVVVTVVEPTVGIVKSSDAGTSVTPGQVVTYTLKVSNTGTSPAHDTAVSDPLPADLTIDASTVSPGSYDSATRTLSYATGTLAAGATTTYTYKATVANPIVSSNTISNTATVAADSIAGGGRTYSKTSTVSLKAPDVTIAKTNTSPGVKTIGESSTYQLKVTIPAGTTTYDATVIDTLPTDQQFGSFVSSSCASGAATCSPDVAATLIGSPSATDRRIGFSLGDVASSTAARVITITYTAIVAKTATTGETLTNTALVGYDSSDKTTPTSTVPTASSFDVTSSTATATASVAEPKLTLDKSVAHADGTTATRAVPGETLTYSIAVKNTGTASAYAVKVSDSPDKRLTDFTPVAGSAGTVTDSDPSDGSLAWTIDGPIAAGDTATVKYTLTVPSTLDQSDEVDGPEISNTAGVTSYLGVPKADQVDGRDYKTYTDVTPDTVGVELDLASIGDRVWLDQDGDGIQDSGEPGLAGVKVTVVYLGADGVLGGGDDETHVTTTDANGNWTVADLPGGKYQVTVDTSTLPVAGLTPSYDLAHGTTGATSTWTGTLAENAKKTDVDFGFTGTGSIGDRVWYDQDGDGVQDSGEPGLEGATVTVTWAGPDGDLATTDDNLTYTTTTDADGGWTVDGLPAGRYGVAVSGQRAGYEPVSGVNGASASSTTTLTAGQNRTDQDFGFAGTASIGDYVWLDSNGDGVQDASEKPIVGAQLQATWTGPNGEKATFTTTTDANGKYAFDDLLPGSYVVKVVGALPDNVTNSYDEDGNGNSATTVDLAVGEQHDTADFGYHSSSVLGDRVWWDRNHDGVQGDAAVEPGLPGVDISVLFAGADGVFGTADDLTFTTTTDADGDWLVQDVPAGKYRVTVGDGVPAGFAPTYDPVHGTTGADGTSSVTLTADDPSNLDQDFGYAGDLSIGDTVWLDRDGDGVQDAGEPGLPGVGVTLVWFGPDGVKGGGDDVTLTTTTDADGKYSFDGLPAGKYSVTLDKTTLLAGLQPSYDLDGNDDYTTGVTLTTASRSDVDFGLQGTGSIGDLVWLDRDGDGTVDAGEKGIGGVTVDVLWAGPDGVFGTDDDHTFTTVTKTDGSYSVIGLPAGDYRVTVDPDTVPAGLAVTSDENGAIDGVSTVTLAAGERHTTADFGYTGAGSIGRTVYLDSDGDGTQGAGEKGVPGQKVDLVWAGPDGVLGTADDQTWTTTTDADGHYAFDNLPDGPFRVTVDGGIASRAANTGDPDGGTASSSDLTLTGGESNTEQDFGYRGDNTIGDTVWWDENGDGVDQATEKRLEGVTVTATWLGPDGVQGGGDDIVFTTTTDADGKYSFADLPDGTYSVSVTAGVPAGLSPSADGSGPVDGTSVVTVSDGESNLDQDFGFTGLGSIGDTVWLDSDGDGKKGSTEPGIPGVTVTLTWAGPDGLFGTADDETQTTTTSAKGAYLFARLPAGDYRVALTNLPGGLTATADPDGGGDSVSALTLASGESNLAQDFGYRGSATVGDTIWLDVDGNGKKNGNEPGLGGIPVTGRLAGADGVLGTADDIVVHTTTAKDGTYRFTGLPAGPITVSYSSSDLPKGDRPSSDLDGGTRTTATLTLATGDERLDVDFGVRGTSTLGGTVFDDTNHNGTQDPGEKGIPGVSVVITYDGPDGPVTIVVVTGPDGTWSVPNLPSGGYTVTVDPSTVPKGMTASTGTSTQIFVTPGASAQVPTPVSAVSLAFTGTDLRWTLFVGLSLLLAGAAAFVVSRRPDRRRRLG